MAKPLKPNAVTRHIPQFGTMRPVIGVGWQHGDTPKAPVGLLKASRDAWATWMASWFASQWTPADLPGLELTIKLYDQVQRGHFARMSQLQRAMDGYGITPQGQQARRWLPPKPSEAVDRPSEAPSGPYSHLRLMEKAADG